MMVDIFPLAKLPDELLMQIFSKITHFPTKLRLELVSKRLSYLARKLPSWEGCSQLDLVCKPLEGNSTPLGLFKPPCKANSDWRQNLRINGITVQSESYLAAVNSLLSRMEAKRLTLHVKEGPDGLAEVFRKNHQRVNVQYLEYHRLSSLVDGLIIELLQSNPERIRFFSCIVEIPEDRLSNTLPKVNTAFFPNPYYALQNCSNLQSFTMASYLAINCEHLEMVVSSLEGKPLKEVCIYNTRQTQMSIVQLAQICTRVSGDGVKRLTLDNFTNVSLSCLSRVLGPKAAGVLESLTIRGLITSADFDLIEFYKMQFMELPMLPHLFPNLQYFYLDDGQFTPAGRDKEIVDSIARLLENIQKDNVKREIVFDVVFVNDGKRVLDDLRNLAFGCNLIVDIEPHGQIGSHVVALRNQYINVSINVLMQT